MEKRDGFRCLTNEPGMAIPLPKVATTFHLRQINQLKVVHTMLRLRRASRVKLAEATGMSQTTIGRIADDLIAQHVLTEIDNDETPMQIGPKQLGRPVKMLELDRTRMRFLLIQLGVRQTRIAATPVAIPESERWTRKFATPNSKEAWLEGLRRACAKLPLRNIEAVIMSCPGVVDEQSGRVLLSPNLRWSEQIDFPDSLRTITRAPVFFLQEIRALALGQLAIEPTLEDFLLVDFGDGLGAASVIGGKLQSGHIPLSGELGHTPVLNNNRRCGCGSIGCIETLVSRSGLIKSFVEHGGARSWKSLIAEVSDQGMPKWFQAAFDAAAINVAGAINMDGIPNVLCTGSIAEFSETAAEYFFSQVRRDAMWTRLGNVTCRTAHRRRMAGMITTGIDRAMFAAAL
jgi:predicted NBD/HSP70 family sugar kinase